MKKKKLIWLCIFVFVFILISFTIYEKKSLPPKVNTHPWPMKGQNPQHTGQSQYKGPQRIPLVKWKFKILSEVTSSPVVALDGTIYVDSGGAFPGGPPDTSLYALSPTGSLKWRYITEDYIFSPAIAPDETIYFGSGDKNLYALNPDGTLKWKYATGDKISPSAVAPDGTIYFGSYDKNFYALNPDGTLKWRYETRDIIWSFPAIAPDRTIYFGSDDKNLYALNPDGTSKWKYETGGEITSSPSVAPDGTIYFSSDDKNFYALNPDGRLKWKYAVSSVTSFPSIAKDGTIYFGTYSGYLYALNPDGTLKWKYREEFYYNDSIYSSPAIGADGTIYVGINERHAFLDTMWSTGYLYALTPNGEYKWRVKFKSSSAISSDIYSSPAIGADGTIYIGSGNGFLYAIGGW